MKLSEAIIQTPPKILLFGKAGTAKTPLATSAGSVSEIIDLDRGLLSSLKREDAFTKERHGIWVTPCYDKNPSAPTAFEEAKKRVYEISALCGAKTYPHKFLILDSLTALGEHAMRKILGGKVALLQTGKAVPITLPEWGLAISEIENMLVVLRSLPIPVCVVAHELTQEQDASTQIKIWALGSKLPDKIPTYFDEIWYSRINGNGSDRQQVLQTQSTSNILARSRGQLPDGIKGSEGMRELMKKIGYTL